MQIDGKRLSELAGRVTSASDRNSRREEMEERCNLAELIRPPNGIAACVVTSGCKIHRPEWNAIPLWRGRAACVNTAKWGCIHHVLLEGRRGLGALSRQPAWSGQQTHASRYSAVAIPSRMGQAQNKSPPDRDGTDAEQTAVSCSVCACCACA